MKFLVIAAASIFLSIAEPVASEGTVKYPDAADSVTLLDYSSLSESDKIVYCIWWLEAEVNNGGFHQFFSNSSGKYTAQTLEALRSIGATRTAGLLEQAIEIAYPDGFPADAEKHDDAIAEDEKTLDALDELDRQFWRYEEDLSLLVNQFLARSAASGN